MKYSKWQSWLQSVSRIISDACSVHCFELMENHRNCFFVYFHTIAPTAACTYACMSAFNQSKRVYIVWRQTYVYVLGGGRWILNCDIEDITNDYVAAINKLHQLWENIFELQLRAFPLSILSNIHISNAIYIHDAKSQISSFFIFRSSDGNDENIRSGKFCNFKQYCLLGETQPT